MFGRDPGLPVDFLLGRVRDPVPGKVQDWVAEHQARVRVAFEHAQDHLLAAAGHRKERYDQGVDDELLRVGQLVYIRDHSARGHHKIHDIWSSVVYQVHRVPHGEGSVYTIAPVGDLERVRNVHRNMLKAQVGPTMVAPPHVPLPSLPTVPEGNSSSDDDPWVMVPETLLPSAAVGAGNSSARGPVVATPSKDLPVLDAPLAQGQADTSVNFPSPASWLILRC